MKIRIKFRKYGVMKFIGHLDMMRYFQKAFRRSGIDIRYTEGFSPHQVMSFAAPLGVGITSDGEYLDIEAHTSKSSAQAIADLNAVMTDGIEITGYVRLDDRAKPAMSAVAAADYEIWLKEEYAALQKEPTVRSDSFPWLQDKLEAFFINPQEVCITKKTKKSETILDLKRLVYEFRILPPQARFFEKPAFYLKTCTGSTDNLKPELVMEAFFRHMEIPYEPYALQVHRKDVYYMDADGGLKPLLEAGENL